MKEQDYQQLTLSAEVSPASRSPWLESKKAKGTTVTCGRKCSELSENLRRVGLSVRTYLESCELPLTTFARTWSVLATKSGFLILKLRLSERCTGEKESRLWLTPNAMDSLDARNPEALARQHEKNRPGRTTLSTLREQVVYGKLWPTPTTRDYKSADMNPDSSRFQQGTELNTVVKMWPTPRAGNPGSRKPGTGGAVLAEAVKMYPTPNASDCRDRGNMSQPAIQRRAEIGKQLTCRWWYPRPAAN